MYIEYNDNKLKKICTNLKKAVQKYGPKVGNKLVLRLNQIQSFECLEDVPHFPPFRRHQLDGEYKGYYAIDITERYRLIISPIVEEGENLNDVSLSQIKIIKVMEVSNHYE